MAAKGDGIGKRIEELRKDLGLNQAEFARLIGIARGTLHAYELETSDPGYGSLKGIVKNVKSLNLHWLFTGIEPKYLEEGMEVSLEAVNEKLRLIGILNKRIESLNALNAVTEEEVQELTKQLGNARGKIADQSKQIEALEKRIAALEKQNK